MSLPRRLLNPAPWNTLCAQFRWPLPGPLNIAEEVCERWARAEPDRLAMIYLRPDGAVREYSYAQMSRASSRLTNALAYRGVVRGDRIAILLPQSPETALSHLAAYKMGAIAVPLFTLFGADGLQFRLADSGAKALITDAANLPKIVQIRDALPDLKVIYVIDHPEGEARGFWQELGKAADHVKPVETQWDTPALISYTSGTTGPPKGALHGHKVLLGHLPGVETHHNFLPATGDRMWTPADWAWMGGLMNVMLPSLFYGVPLVAHRMAKFDPDHAFWLMREYDVQNVFLPPTALKLMRQSTGRARLRSVGSGGEALGADLLDWGQAHLGTTINEFYGQTECNLVLGNSHSVMPPRAGSTGRAVPGHQVAILNTDGDVAPAGETGEIAVHTPDPSLFLRYWNRPDKTAEKFHGHWMRTGDEAVMDEEGYVYFSSRTDDVITSSGYRVGPTEIEQCLSSHPDVTIAAVIGLPDPIRTEAVTAYVVLRDMAVASAALERALIDRVRERISPHVAPREVHFIRDMPMTATGKILRRELKAKAMADIL